MSYLVEIVIPDSIKPIERGERFDLPLCDVMEELKGEYIGGVSRIVQGQISEVFVQLEVDDIELALPKIVEVLNEGRAPAGTSIMQRTPFEAELHTVGD